MSKTKNKKEWMSNLRRQLEKELGSQEEWNIAGVDVYICHPPLIIRLENTGKGKFKSSVI